MKPERWRQVDRIFHDALERERHERELFLKRACADDPSLKDEVEALIRAHEDAGSFLKTPSTAPAHGELAGQTFGSYELTSLLGAGGMGEVYRARDSKLKRDVAIKVLPEAFSRDPERVARFQREAEVLASLNHPHIASIYDLAHVGESRFLVLELVEGETLAARLARGPLPVQEALRIAKQIAEGLEAAHEKGIIHRDLKPANIKITPSGNVKVLDFGLAKVRDVEGAAVSNMPTKVTASGPAMIMGTAAYMSPEQANGKPANRTSDIWAFGCVLHEMLSGRHAFQGETTADILATVLKADPDWSRLPEETPESIRRLLRRCLEKNSNNRLQHIGDARIEIAEAQAHPLSELRPVDKTSRRKERLVWMLFLALIVVVSMVWTLRPVQPLDELHFEVVTPASADPSSLAISPDGMKIVFQATSQGQSRLWLRRLDSDAQEPLPGTEGAQHPFWSPDSRSVGFFADSKLKRIDLDGGMPQVLAIASDGIGATWNQTDEILFVPLPGTAVFRVSAKGGNPVAVTEIGPQQDSHGYPHFLPDGRHFLYYVYGESGGVYAGELDGSGTWRLASADTPAVYGHGYVFFGRQGLMFAQAFDPDRMTLAGNAFPVGAAGLVESLSVSASGTMAYRAGPGGSNLRKLVWLDRSGNQISELSEPIPWLGSAELSPDERRVVAQSTKGGNYNVWLLDAARKVFNPLTDTPAVDAFPVWSPDGREIVYWSNRDPAASKNQQRKAGAAGALYRRSASGGGNEDMLYPDGPAVDWSPKGDFLLYRTQIAGMGWDLLALPLHGERNPFPVVQTNADERDAQFSPDGKWIAYQSNRSGRFEIYLQPFPRGNFTPISTNGGAQVRWRRDGKELFYIALDGMLMSVLIRISADGQTIDAGTPVALFPTHIGAVQFVDRQAYMVSQDGARFLMNTVAEELNTSPIQVILNWKPKP